MDHLGQVKKRVPRKLKIWKLCFFLEMHMFVKFVVSHSTKM